MLDKYLEELRFCLDLWEIQGHCKFGGMTKCEECAVPYILWKLSTGEVIHGTRHLSFEEWQKKIDSQS